MDGPRTLAYALSASRVVYGVAVLTRPTRNGPSWIGPRAARRPASQVLTRAVGARDLALAGGTVAALRAGRNGEAARWMAAHAVADATDLTATAAARGRLPRASARFAMAVAAVSTVVAVAGAAGLARATAGGQPPQG